MVDGQRDVGAQGFADRLAVVPALGDGDLLEVLLDAVGDLVQDHCAVGCRGLAPGRCGLVRGVQRQLDIFLRRPGDLAERLAVHRGDVLEVHTLDRGDTLAADPVVVAGLVADHAARLTGWDVDRQCDLLIEGRTPRRAARSSRARWPSTTGRVASSARSAACRQTSRSSRPLGELANLSTVAASAEPSTAERISRCSWSRSACTSGDTDDGRIGPG